MGLDRTGPGDNFVRDLSKQNGPLDWVKAPGQPEKAPNQPQMSQDQPEKAPDQREEPANRTPGVERVDLSPSKFKLEEYRLDAIYRRDELTKDLIAANKADLRDIVARELEADGIMPVPPTGDKALPRDNDEAKYFARKTMLALREIENRAEDVDDLRYRVIMEYRKAWGRESEWIRTTDTGPEILDGTGSF